jgi:hypothetical protein
MSRLLTGSPGNRSNALRYIALVGTLARGEAPGI